MKIFAKQIIGLKVETKSGQFLGRVHDFEVAGETLEIKNFFVRPSGLVKGLVRGDLIIGKNSVMSIDEEKLIVEDLAEAALAKEKEYKQQLAAESLPVSASVRDDC